MNQQPDKLFKTKLEGYQRPTSAKAWDKVAANLDKKDKGVLWFRIAAAILVLCVAFAAITIIKQQSTPVLATKDKPVRANEKSEQKASDPKAEKSETKAGDNSGQSQPEKLDKKENVKSKSVKETPRRQPKNVERQEGISAVKGNNIANNNTTQEELPSIKMQETPVTEGTIVAVNAATSQPTKKVKITFSAAEADQYLNKNSLADATSDEKKESTLRKLLDKAYDLKHNQDPLGELRQKKDEILALNFKSDKRSQNR